LDIRLNWARQIQAALKWHLSILSKKEIQNLMPVIAILMHEPGRWKLGRRYEN